MAALTAFFGSLLAQQPQLKVPIVSAGEIRLSWPFASSDFVLEETTVLSATALWTPVPKPPKVEGGKRVVRIAAGRLSQFYRLRQGKAPLTTIKETSPASGKGDVAVTRETILRFSSPLASTTVVGNDRLYAQFGGRRLLSRVELSTDRLTLTLFYLEPLPGRARIRVTFNGDGLKDGAGQFVDADRNGEVGGIFLLDFDTLANGGVAETLVTGRVFASELAQAIAAQGSSLPSEIGTRQVF